MPDFPIQPIVKRSFAVGDRRSSVSIEECFWREILRTAKDRDITVGDVIAEVKARGPDNLSSALRQLAMANLAARVSALCVQPGPK